MKITRFEEIDAWKASRTLSKKIHAFTESSGLRDRELRSQTRRAASSVMANIAEGFNAGSDPEFARFLRISRRSADELQSHLYCALDRRILPQDRFDELYGDAEDVKHLIGGFIRYLTQQKPSQKKARRALDPKTED